MKNLHHKLYGNLHQQRQQQHTKDQTTLVQHQNVPPTSLHHRSKHWDTVKLHQHDKMRKIAKRRLHRTISHFTFKSDECQGYNVEQRKCNMFDCNGKRIHFIIILARNCNVCSVEISIFYEKRIWHWISS